MDPSTSEDDPVEERSRMVVATAVSSRAAETAGSPF